MKYTHLSDASIYDPRYGSGTTEILYNRDFYVPKLSGLRMVFDRQHYTKVGNIECDDPEKVFELMQGEMWSPNGEANEFLGSLGLRHTSMSVGDIIKIGDKFFLVMGVGFREVFDK